MGATIEIDAVREARAIEAAIARCRGMVGALLPALHAIQDELGFIPEVAVAQLADALNLSRAEVHGTISFYHELRTSPPGRRVLRICRAEACQARGADALVAHAEATLGCAIGETSATGVTLEAVYCLGNCACAPAVMCELPGQGVRELVGRVTPERLVALASEDPPAPVAIAPAATATTRVFVPRDASARSLGADAIAAALASDPRARVVRNGSRGLAWLEPLVEVETAAGRIAYGPVTPADVPGLLAAGLLDGGEHPLRLGPTEQLPYLATQERLTFARCGVIDPLDLADYARHGGWRGLAAALAKPPAAIVADLLESGLRGRGGAAFPTGIKWRTVLETAAPQKYVVCNADEGDSGTFSDRLLMEGDPFVLIEGMAIAGLATGATRGFIYLRSEYPDAEHVLARAIELATAAGYLGNDVRGSGRAFHLELRRGAGSYVCGEETAMLESLEGKRGIVRQRPPVPAVAGLLGAPTVVNNVNTLASVPIIMDRGPAFYRAYGVGRSRGTVAFQLGGNVKRGGLVERALGLTARELIETYGGGTASGRPIRAVQIGGPLGAYLPADALDVPLDYEVLAERGALLGHGGVVVFDDTVDMAKMARFAMEFCAIESCGKCTPCRIGSRRGVELIDQLVKSARPAVEAAVLRELCDTMTHASLCALGGMTAYPVESALRYFAADFGLEG